jgi:hypothetical protein
MFQAKDSRLRERLAKLMPRWAPIRHREASRQHILAEAGFRMLGQDALPAVPALVQLTRHADSEIRLRALVSLGSIGLSKDALLPVLTERLKDADWQVRATAATLLQDKFPEEAPSVPAEWRRPSLPHSQDAGNVTTNAAGFE